MSREKAPGRKMVENSAEISRPQDPEETTNTLNALTARLGAIRLSQGSRCPVGCSRGHDDLWLQHLALMSVEYSVGDD